MSSSGVSGESGCSVIGREIPAFEIRQAYDLELRRRPPQKRADEEELVRILGRQGSLGCARLRQPRFDLDPRGGSSRQRADRGNPSAADEDGPPQARLHRRNDEAEAGGAETLRITSP